MKIIIPILFADCFFQCSLLSYSSATLSIAILSWGRSFASVQNNSRTTALSPSKSMRLKKKINYFVPFTVLWYLNFSFILCNRTSIPSMSTLDFLQVLFSAPIPNTVPSAKDKLSLCSSSLYTFLPHAYYES